jgi:hypothetical protein
MIAKDPLNRPSVDDVISTLTEMEARQVSADPPLTSMPNSTQTAPNEPFFLREISQAPDLVAGLEALRRHVSELMSAGPVSEGLQQELGKWRDFLQVHQVHPTPLFERM